MAHGTRIGGVQKNVTAGFTRINGVNKKVKKGLTLVGGVQKDINFGGGTVVVTITGDGGTLASVKINGTTYSSAAVVEVEAGAEALFSASSSNGITREIYLNGVVVASGSSANPVTYSMPVTQNIGVELKRLQVVASTYRGMVYITTE